MLSSIRLLRNFCFLAISFFACFPVTLQGARPSQAARELEEVLFGEVDPDEDATERANALLDLLADSRSAVSVWHGPVAEPTIADRAVEALTGLGKRAFPAIAARISTELDPARFRRMATVIGRVRINDEQITEALCRRGRDDKARIREAVLRALGQTDASGMLVDDILVAGLQDTDSNVVFIALWVGSRRENEVPGATRILRSMLSNQGAGVVNPGDVPRLRRDAVFAMGRIGRLGDGVVKDLEELFLDEDLEMRVVAAVSHARLTGDRRGVELLLEMILDESLPPYARYSAAAKVHTTGLLNVKDSETLAPLLASANDYFGAYLLTAVVAGNPADKLKILEHYSDSGVRSVRDAAMSMLADEYDGDIGSLKKLVSLAQDPRCAWYLSSSFALMERYPARVAK